MPDGKLIGRRVLVIEDEYYLAETLDRALRAAGAHVLGPAGSIEEALVLLSAEDVPEAAILDMNLGGEMAKSVAEALRARGVPSLVVTWYDHAALPESAAAMCRLEKPVETKAVLRELARLLDEPS